MNKLLQDCCAAIVLLACAFRAPAPAQAQSAAPETAATAAEESCTNERLSLAEARSRVEALDVQRGELKRRASQNSLGLPIAGVVVGFGIAVEMLGTIESDEPRGANIGPAVPLLALGVGSAVWLGRRVHTRRAIRAKLGSLELQLGPAHQQVLLAANALARCEGAPGKLAFPPELDPSAASLARRQSAHESALRSARYPVGEPIALIVVGFTGTVALSIAAFRTWWVYAPSFELDTQATPHERRMMRGFGSGAVLSAAVGSLGVAWLVQRVRLRRASSAAAQSAHASRLTLVPAVGKGSVSLALSFAL